MAEVIRTFPQRSAGAIAAATRAALAPMGARRLYLFGGIALIALGMIFGDIFAVFILHQNAGLQTVALIQASRAVAAGNPVEATQAFVGLGNLLEDRGTKVDAHVHILGAGYLALLLALIQPYVALSRNTKKSMALLFTIGGTLLPMGIFLIRYVGLAYSPFTAIGWASVLADTAGAILIAVLLGQSWGFLQYLKTRQLTEPEIPRENSMASRALLTGGTLLILLGFLHGAFYAGAMLYRHEQMETGILGRMIHAAAAGRLADATAEVNDFGNLAGARAVNIAAHSHVIEFGVLAMLLSFIQPYVFLSEKWKRTWVKLLLGGSVLLPVFVLLELKLGLLAGGIADFGGLLVIIALIGMLAGVVRYTGSLDATEAGR